MSELTTQRPTTATKIIKISPYLQEMMAGTMGGVAQVAVGFPFDTIKVHLQTQPEPPKYRNAMHAFKTIVREEGLRGLYKGATSPLMGIGFCNAVLFSTNGFFRRLIQGEDRMRILSLTEIATAGALTGAIIAFFSCPQELLKVKMQTQNQKMLIGSSKQILQKPPEYKGVIDAGIKIYRKKGIIGMYRGFTITVLRDTPSFAAYFFVYEGTKRILGSQNNDGVTRQLSNGELLFAGGAAGAACWIPCYPQDVIKSRMQSNLKFNSTLDCIRDLINQAKYSGKTTIRTFFKGFGPTMARAAPANAATFFAYETAKRFMESE
ncbi:hypothetical protein G9A89_002439 [Geosiphon pyriformis]|nr:hypothetical protein G9A89_002439 [Geosiphon pyriformis]